MENNMERVAAQFINAIKTIAEKPENLENLECYLSYHFEAWMKNFANTPEGPTAEMVAFVNMEI